MKRIPASPGSSAHQRAFTLVELMISTALIGLLMFLLLSTVTQTNQIWRRTTNKISQFQASRNAFEALTRNLGQATLNTYWTVHPPKPTNLNALPGWVPRQYIRASDLHFMSGKASQSTLLGGGESVHPTHSVFFQAPLGVTALNDNGKMRFEPLDHLLSAVGYYVEWNNDDNRPEFLDNIDPKLPKRWRYRLMEVNQPAEQLGIFGMSTTKGYKPTDWIQSALGKSVSNWTSQPNAQKPRSLAENVVALVILPKKADRATDQNDNPLDLAPEYEYDSRPNTPYDSLTPLQKKQVNQLPPVVYVGMVAIDEDSAKMWETMQGSSDEPPAPDFSSGLFPSKSLKSMQDVVDDFRQMEDRLVYPGGGTEKRKLNYRIFTAEVVIRGSKWSKPE